MRTQDKGLIAFNQKPLIQYVIEAAQDISKNIAISANRNLNLYSKFGLPIISDDIKGFQGPLAGIQKALLSADDYLLVLPCDTPFIEPELITRLIAAVAGHDIAVAYDGKAIQPTFCLINKSLKDNLTQYINSKERKLARWIMRQNHIKVDMADKPRWFININSPQDFARHCHKTLYNGIPILGFVGFSGSGKTTLLSGLIANLKQKNIKTAIIKHAHHDFDIDKPGKDSYILRKSGATEVIVASDRRFALMVERENNTLSALLKRLDTTNLDLILVESFKHENINKIEVHRPELGHSMLYRTDKNIIGLATNKIPDKCSGKLVLNINDVAMLTEFVLSYVK